MAAVADHLRAAKARIEDPGDWCQGRANIGERCCATQAFAETRGDKVIRDLAWGHLMKAAERAGFSAPSKLNDKTDHATVMAMYDGAIASAEASC